MYDLVCNENVLEKIEEVISHDYVEIRWQLQKVAEEIKSFKRTLTHVITVSRKIKSNNTRLCLNERENPPINWWIISFLFKDPPKIETKFNLLEVNYA